MQKVLFSLKIEDGWPPAGAEGVWCELVGSHYKLKSVPFFISGLAVDDVFSAPVDLVSGQVHEFELLESSGHSVVWVMNSEGIDDSEFKDMIIRLGCRIENITKFSITAIDVPPSVIADDLDNILDAWEEKGLDFAFPVWRHEAGN